MPKIDKAAFLKEIKSNAPRLYSRIQKLHDLLQHESFGGKIDLGTDPRKIDWDAMPPEVAACFKPEFKYQPKDITSFTISTELDATTGNSIKIDLKRQDSWWSQVHVGAIVRKDMIGGTSYIGCQAKEAQPKAAREAMAQLGAQLWQHGLTEGSEDKELPFIVKDVNELRLTEAVLVFAVGQLENRIGTKAT